MRQIVLDLETTGLDPKQGHRIIEFSGLEMINRVLTDYRYHQYINPERAIEEDAKLIHGITNEVLAEEETFSGVAQKIIDFISGAELIIHNAEFDVGFLNAEFARLNKDPVEKICTGVIDTLQLARNLFPGKRNSLDALCDRFDIDRSDRVLHGALTDCYLLTKVYLLLTKGQENLAINLDKCASKRDFFTNLRVNKSDLVLRLANKEERDLHNHYLDQLGNNCLWRTIKPE